MCTNNNNNHSDFPANHEELRVLRGFLHQMKEEKKTINIYLPGEAPITGTIEDFDATHIRLDLHMLTTRQNIFKITDCYRFEEAL